MTPFTVKKKLTNDSVPVPCGKCPNCHKRRISQWSFRLMQEDKVSTSSLFITLTYDTKHVHITNKGFMNLNKRDVQLFFKRLRKLNPDGNIKYYLAGEYGGQTQRPHYHIILFNALVQTIQEAWQLGQVHYGQVSAASVGYTLKYISKAGKIPMHKNDDRLPEFALMSKGLGKNYLTKAMLAWHKKDKLNRMYVNVENGKKVGMPRYYKDKIYHEQERKAIGYHARKAMLVKLEKDYAKNPNYYRDKYEAAKAAFEKVKHDQKTRRKV